MVLKNARNCPSGETWPVTYFVAENEGHTQVHVLGSGVAWAHPINNIASFAAIEKLFAETLGTPNQSMDPALAQHLKEMTVLSR
jgi:hypothetical protein